MLTFTSAEVLSAAETPGPHLYARQVSERGGELWCELAGERVVLKGKAVLTLQGSLLVG